MLTKFDKKWLDKLFEFKPDATGKEVVAFLEKIGKYDQRRSETSRSIMFDILRIKNGDKL